jgi:hypothetical protein
MFSDTTTLYLSLRVKDQVSHHRKQQVNNFVYFNLYVLDMRREDKKIRIYDCVNRTIYLLQNKNLKGNNFFALCSCLFIFPWNYLARHPFLNWWSRCVIHCHNLHNVSAGNSLHLFKSFSRTHRLTQIIHT